MMESVAPATTDVPDAARRDRLDSWKEIASHLGRTVRTVQRWERTCCLPVHRHLHSESSSVYAYRSELDAWWISRGHRATPSADSRDDSQTILRNLPVVDASPSREPEQLRRIDVRRTVGREIERALLRRSFEQATGGSGLLITVCGEPGIGKTTLVEEFLTEVESIGRARVGCGRCSERVTGTEAYLPLLDALEDIVRRDSARRIGHTLKETAPLWFAQLGSTVAREYNSRPSIAEPAPATPDRLKRELAAFLQEVSRDTPLAIFLDDLHWADPSTLDLLAYLVRQFGSARLMIVVAYRPEELLTQRHPFIAVKHDLQARGLCRGLALEFLTREDLETYIDRAFSGHALDRDFCDLVFSKTEGNPLFMVALLDYLRDSGALGMRDGRWVLTRSVPDAARDMPESVRGMIQRKVDRLPEAEHQLLTAASVQGQEFDSTVAAVVLGRDLVDAEEQLDRLEHVHGFVRKTSDVELADGTLSSRYRFIHVLYQDRLYAAITPARKIRLSRTTAETLERLHGGHTQDIAAQLAGLYEVAREFFRAAEFYLIGARHAADVFAFADAVLLGQRALDALSRLPDSSERHSRELEVRLAIGAPMKAVLGFASDELLRNYERAHALCVELERDDELPYALWGLWASQIIRSDTDASGRTADRLDRVAQSRNDSTLAVQAAVSRMIVAFQRGDFERARDCCLRTLSLYDGSRDVPLRIAVGWDPGMSAHVYKAWCSLALGSMDGALAEVEAGVSRARELGHIQTLAYALFFSAIVHEVRGDHVRFAEDVDELSRLARDYQLVHFNALTVFMQGQRLALEGRRADGLRQMREGFAVYAALRARNSRPRFAAALAEELAAGGCIEEGLGVVEEEIRTLGSTRFHESELFRVRGEILRLRAGAGDFDAAQRSLEHAVAVARQQGARTFEVRALTSLCSLDADSGFPQGLRHADQLNALISTFIEGLETAPLRSARSVLTVLPMRQ